MRHTLRAVVMVGAIVLCGVAGQTAAMADAIRIALVTAENQDDYANNVALLPAYEALLKKGNGVKDVHVFTDAAKMIIGTVSVWGDAADAKALTGSADWKAVVAKQKAKSLNIDIYQVQ